MNHPTTITRRDHRETTQALAAAIVRRRQTIGVHGAIGMGEIVNLVMAQQRYLIALDDQIRELNREEIGRG